MPRSYCPRCDYPDRTCLCHAIDRTGYSTRLTILQHPSEAGHAKNTSRLITLVAEEDTAMWDQPWSARLPMRRIEEPIYEYACHEGNHGLMGILAGWRRWEVEGKNQGRIPSVDDDE